MTPSIDDAVRFVEQFMHDDPSLVKETIAVLGNDDPEQWGMSVETVRERYGPPPDHPDPTATWVANMAKMITVPGVYMPASEGDYQGIVDSLKDIDTEEYGARISVEGYKGRRLLVGIGDGTKDAEAFSVVLSPAYDTDDSVSWWQLFVVVVVMVAILAGIQHATPPPGC